MANNAFIQTRHWWLFLLRGIALIGLGILVLYTPVGSYIVLSFLFGAAVLATGIAELLHALANRNASFWWLRLIAGLADLVLGVLLVTHIVASMLVLPYVIAAFFIIRGIALLTLASAMRSFVWMIIGGMLMLLFAIIIVINPVYGAFTLVSWAGTGLIFAGLINASLAYWISKLNDRRKKFNRYNL